MLKRLSVVWVRQCLRKSKDKEQRTNLWCNNTFEFVDFSSSPSTNGMFTWPSGDLPRPIFIPNGMPNTVVPCGTEKNFTNGMVNGHMPSLPDSSFTGYIIAVHRKMVSLMLGQIAFRLASAIYETAVSALATSSMCALSMCCVCCSKWLQPGSSITSDSLHRKWYSSLIKQQQDSWCIRILLSLESLWLLYVHVPTCTCLSYHISVDALDKVLFVLEREKQRRFLGKTSCFLGLL